MFPPVRIAFAVFLCLLAAGCVAASLSEKQFTDEFIARASRENPQFHYSTTEPLVVKIDRGDDGPRTVNLNGVFVDYVIHPDRISQLMAPYLREATGAASEPTAIDTGHIVPVIKDRGWLDETTVLIRSQGGTNAFAYDRLNADLIIVYALDTPDRIAYLSEEQLEEAGFSKDTRRKRATDNLIALMPPTTTVSKAGPLYLAYGGSDYAPSAILFDDFWRQVAPVVKGDIVLSVPTRTTLVFTGTAVPYGIQSLRKFAKETAKSNEHKKLTTRLFRYDKGELKRYRETR